MTAAVQRPSPRVDEEADEKVVTRDLRRTRVAFGDVSDDDAEVIVVVVRVVKAENKNDSQTSWLRLKH